VSQHIFDSLKKIFSFEIAEYCFNTNNISRCLYHTMELQQQYGDNAYLATLTGKCFNTMYTRQKEHMLNTVVSLPFPQADKNFNTLLEFIQNLGLQDIAAIGYSYLKKHYDAFSADKEFAKTFTESKKNLNNR
jgi:hypothetical protein